MSQFETKIGKCVKNIFDNKEGNARKLTGHKLDRYYNTQNIRKLLIVNLSIASNFRIITISQYYKFHILYIFLTF